MAERIPQNIVIVLDTSRSMYRSDYKPNRLESSKNALKELIKQRIEVDTSSSFAIVTFSDEAKKIIDFSNFPDQLYSAIDSLTFGGLSAMGDGLALSIKIIISELRKVGAKIPRIVLLSDGNYTQTDIDPIKMAKLASSVNIKIDSFRLGDSDSHNILKRLSDISNGRHYYINDSESLIGSVRELSLDNVKSFEKKLGSPSDSSALLSKIAAKLLKVSELTKDQEENLKQLRGEVDYKKCSICFADKDPTTKGSFYITGRYCPNCQMPFHIYCLAGWAASQKDIKLKRSGTCRCPHCFYLLKIPTEVAQVQKLRVLSGTQAQKIIGPAEPLMFDAKSLNIDELGEGALYEACPQCNYIFEPNQKVVMCGNSDCQALYHEDCFHELKDQRCKKCEAKLFL